MSESSSPTPRKPQIDVRRLSLVQLQALAQRGSRRARKELEARMAAPPPQVRTAWTAPVAPPPMPLPGALAAMERAPAMASAGGAEDPRIRELEFLARQDREDAQTRGLPRLLGLLLMGWGGLLTFAGLVTLAYRGGGYYLVMGAATLAVGWLLLKGRIWAIYLQSAAVLIALAWAWANSRGIAGMLAQAAPFWIAACWIAVPHVREPLE